jgi:hypothetical protein
MRSKKQKIFLCGPLLSVASSLRFLKKQSSCFMQVADLLSKRRSEDATTSGDFMLQE